jgi:hypothetical protein
MLSALLVLPSPQVMVAVKSEAGAALLASVNVATVKALKPMPSVALGLLIVRLDRGASATLMAVLLLTEEPPTSRTVTARVKLPSSA